MKLWLITHKTDDGDNLDWFIAARTLFDAKAYWAAIPMVHDYGLDRGDIENAFEVTCANLSDDVLPGHLEWDGGYIKRVQ